MLVLCDCCHSEYDSEEFPIGEQLCPVCFKQFVIDPQLDLVDEDEEFIPIDDYISETDGES